MKAAGVMYRTDAGKVLYMMRAPGKTMEGKWSFPAGHIEPGEAPEACARREFREETGHDLGNTPLMPVSESKDGFVLFSARGQHFNPQLCDEHTGHLWADIGNAPEPLHPGIEQAFDYQAMDSARRMDDNGWYEVKGNPISKVGVFPYYGRQISAEAEPDKIYMVFRSQEELSNSDTLESFKLLPWINEHVMLGPSESGMTAPEEKGIDGVIGEDVYFDMNGGILRANIKVFSDNLGDLIASGKRELSAGYRCKYKKCSGVWDNQPYDYIQTNIRGNHLALVHAGRMGPDVAVLDHMKFTFDAKDIDMEKDEMKKQMDEISENLKKVGDSMKSMDERMCKVEDQRAKDEKDKAEDEKDDKDGEDEAEEKKAEDAKTMDERIQNTVKSALDAALKPLAETLTSLQNGGATKVMRAEIRKQSELTQNLHKFGVALDGADLSLPEMQLQAVKKLGLNCESGQEQVALDAYFHKRPTRADEAGFAIDTAQDDKKGNVIAELFSKPKAA